MPKTDIAILKRVPGLGARSHLVLNYTPHNTTPSGASYE
jgi:hypothetical protein